MLLLKHKITDLIHRRSVKEKGCLVWIGMVDSMGYAFAKMAPHWVKGTRVSRMVLALKLGRIPNKDEWACHTCDNPLCVNPEHIYCGDAFTNNQDTVIRGRRGVRKLTQEQNSEIVRLYSTGNYTQEKLGELFGVSQIRVSQIVRKVK